MMGDEAKWISGVIHPKVSAAGLRQLWNNRPEAGMSPGGELITDGQNFKIKYWTTWPLSDLKPAFLMVVRQLGNLEAVKAGRPPDTRIEWSE
jgi:hypothetical protein